MELSEKVKGILKILANNERDISSITIEDFLEIDAWFLAKGEDSKPAFDYIIKCIRFKRLVGFSVPPAKESGFYPADVTLLNKETESSGIQDIISDMYDCMLKDQEAEQEAENQKDEVFNDVPQSEIPQT